LQTEFLERRNVAVLAVEVADADLHVDDRLGRQPGYRRRPDMIYAGRGGSEFRADFSLPCLVLPWPALVLVDDGGSGAGALAAVRRCEVWPHVRHDGAGRRVTLLGGKVRGS